MPLRPNGEIIVRTAFIREEVSDENEMGDADMTARTGLAFQTSGGKPPVLSVPMCIPARGRGARFMTGRIFVSSKV
jgi:hypothetical protein